MPINCNGQAAAILLPGQTYVCMKFLFPISKIGFVTIGYVIKNLIFEFQVLKEQKRTVKVTNKSDKKYMHIFNNKVGHSGLSTCSRLITEVKTS